MNKIITTYLLPGIGVTGTLLGIAAFINPSYVGQKIDTSWFLIFTFIFIWIICILLLKIGDANESNKRLIEETNFNLDLSPIQYSKNEHILILKKTINIQMGTMVSIFKTDLAYEKFIAFGSVHHIQPNAIQIKIRKAPLPKDLKDFLEETNNLKFVKIRPFVNSNQLDTVEIEVQSENN